MGSLLLFPRAFHSTCSRILLPAFCMAALLFCFLTDARSGTSFAGNIRMVEGVSETDYVKIIRPGFNGYLKGKPGDALFERDAVKCGNGVKAVLELSDRTTIIVAPNASVQIDGFRVDRERAQRHTVMKALRGTVRFIVAKLFQANAAGAESSWKDSTVTIETMNAVAGIRGTDLTAIVGENDVEFAVFEGVIGLRSSLMKFGDEIIVGANQISLIRKGFAPGAALPLSPERRDALMKATTLEHPVTQSDSATGKTKNAKKKYDKDDMARDIAADVPFSVVLDRAVESGMSIEDVVAGALDAGANPATVVYTCIQEGYPTSKVVDAAITNGVPATLVFSAAISAGGDTQQVIDGASAAGLPPSEIAGALATATTADLETLSSSPASGTQTPSSVIPPPPIKLSGGMGGGSPATVPVSPYVP